MSTLFIMSLEENEVFGDLVGLGVDLETPSDQVSTALLSLQLYGAELSELGYSLEEQLEFLANPDNLSFLGVFSRHHRDRLQKTLGELSFD